MKSVTPIVTKAECEALSAAILRVLMWFAGLLRRLGSPHRSRRVRWLLKVAERHVECALFLQAVQTMPPPPRRKTHAPPSVRAGFRLTKSRGRLLVKCSRVRLRTRDPLARCARLLAALAAPSRFLARVRRRLRHNLCRLHITPAAPPALGILTRLLAFAPAHADTS